MHTNQQQLLNSSFQQQQQQQQQQPHHFQHPGQMVHPMINDVFPQSCCQVHELNQQGLPPIVEYNKGDRGRISLSDEDDPSLNPEDGSENHPEMCKRKNGSPWQRVKWTDNMVKLLITAVSYVGDDSAFDCSRGGRRKFSVLQKKGKWKSISKVMAERNYYVSPQQCEDKFNDLNKRYKRLNDILGRGTSCQVVENPALLDMMDHVSEKAKEDVRKILSSKQLFYEEMCSYHNGNQLHLPPDPALQRSLHLALRCKDDHDTRRISQGDSDEEDHGADTDDLDDESEGNHVFRYDTGSACFPKRLKHASGAENGEGNTFGSSDCNGRPRMQTLAVDMNVAFPDGSEAGTQNQWVLSRKAQLQEQNAQIQMQMLELEKQRFKWQCFSKKKERELEKFRMENERMKLENDRLALELRRKELESGLH